MKVCTKCGAEKDDSEFYARQRACKECVKAQVRKNRADNIERYREFDRQRANLPHRVQARKDYAETEQGKEAFVRANAAYRKRYPMKYAAHKIVGNALRDAKLFKAEGCEICGGVKKLEAHHDDYTKPLDVRWLCEDHHKEWHRENEPIYE